MAEGIKQKHCGSLLPGRKGDHEDCEPIDSWSGSAEDEASLSSLDNGPLFEMSSLMADLPIKRGLSKFFHGKSQTFASLSEARCIEDLAKKKGPYRKKMKPWKNTFMNQKTYNAINTYGRTISKNKPTTCCSPREGKNQPWHFLF